jgi:gliding motility-associated-like protein
MQHPLILQPKTVRNRLFSLLLLLFVVVQVNAKHIIGGELTYDFVTEVSPGVNRYKFTLTIYRDCNSNGADFDDDASIGIYRGNLSAAALEAQFSAQHDMIVRIPVDTPDCVTSIPSICVQRTNYVFTRDLPVINASYIVVYQRCCRNETIRNLVNPGDVGATYYAEITPLAQQLKNSSPRFKFFPRTIICNQIPLIEDQSATDPDGHQLVYSLCSPLDGGGTILQGPAATSCEGSQPIPACGPPYDQVPFVVPDFTPSAPMGGSPVIQINSTTGLVTGTPNQLGQFVVGICVQEFFNGQLVGTTRREFQFNLADCKPSLVANVTADTTLGPQIYLINSCGPLTVFVKNKSTEISNIDSVRWNVDMGGPQPVTSTDFDLTVTFPDTGRYTAQLILNPGAFCADTALVYINVFPDLVADFDYAYDTCIAGNVTFTDRSVSGPGIVDWNWRFGGPTEISDDQDPSFYYQTPGLKDVQLFIRDTNGCRENITKPILYQPAPAYVIINPDDFFGCQPATITFTNLSTPIDSTYFIVWDYGDGERDTGIISPTHLYTKTGFFTVSVFIRSPIGCEVADTFINLIRVAPSPMANFSCSPDMNLSQSNNTVTFTDLSVGANRWGWKFGAVETSIVQNPVHTFRDTGIQQVILVATHPEGCRDSISKWLDIVPEVNWTMPNAFTPNGDSFNEEYYGNGFIAYAKEFRLTIWNRWGELIYETKDPRAGWNGTINNVGAPVPDGVYVYLVNYQGPRGDDFELRGFVNVIR